MDNEKEEFEIGIIDDNKTKVTQMITMISLGCSDENGHIIKEKYANYILKPIELTLDSKMDTMVDKIINSGVDAVIIDYKLSSQKLVSYTGVLLAKELNLRKLNFPIFVLTAFQDDLFDHEMFDSYLVFDFSRYIEEDAERVELNSKMIEQIKKYRTEIREWQKELEDLLPHAGESVRIDDRILELDTLLEKSICGKGVFSVSVKKDFVSEKIDDLIRKIDLLLKKE